MGTGTPMRLPVIPSGSKPGGPASLTEGGVMPALPSEGKRMKHGKEYTGGMSMKNNLTQMRPVGLGRLSIDELGERAAAIVRDVQFSLNRALTDIVSLGELLCEVKERSEFGRYGSYGRFLADNGLEERMAQYSVAAYRRYADRPDVLEQLGSISKLKELLALPQALEGDFLATHNVAQMSARALRAEVKSARRGASGAQADAEDHQATARGANAPADELTALRAERDALKSRIAEIQQSGRLLERQMSSEQERLTQAEQAQARLKALLEKSREERGRLEEENARLKQAALHADEQRERGTISAAAFGGNVKRFLSENCELPQMGGMADSMGMEERSAFVRGLDMLESFVGSARRALCGFEGEATVR